MSDITAWLTEHVLQTVPWSLRARTGYDHDSRALVMGVFVRQLERNYRWRAKHLVGLSSVNNAFAATVMVIPHLSLALRMNVHMHALVLGSVFVKRDDREGNAVLHLPAPTVTFTLERASFERSGSGCIWQALNCRDSGNRQLTDP